MTFLFTGNRPPNHIAEEKRAAEKTILPNNTVPDFVVAAVVDTSLAAGIVVAVAAEVDELCCRKTRYFDKRDRVTWSLLPSFDC